jgi:hypothetical protein
VFPFPLGVIASPYFVLLELPFYLYNKLNKKASKNSALAEFLHFQLIQFFSKLSERGFHSHKPSSVYPDRSAGFPAIYLLLLPT